MNEILLYGSAILFASYIIAIIIIFGVQRSISDSYYRLIEGKKNYGFIFTLVLWGFSIPIAIVAQTGLMFSAVAGICFVGAASAFKGKDLKEEKKDSKFKDWILTKQVHMVGAFGGIIVGMISAIVDYYALSLVIIAVAFSIFLKLFTKNSIWWIEITAFITIWLTIFLYTIA